MSKGSASGGMGEVPTGTNTNSASGSMLRRMSQAHAILSTATSSHVTHGVMSTRITGAPSAGKRGSLLALWACQGASPLNSGCRLSLVNVLIPADFDVPQRLETPDFVIRPLRMHDVYLDYIAVMTSLDIIKRTRGGDWPTSDLTFEQDLH
jgi:hypothetical protein